MQTTQNRTAIMDPRALPHYEQLLKVAAVALCGELCELYLNQARGLAEYAMLAEHMTGKQFEIEMRRQDEIRLTRQIRPEAIRA